MLLNLRNYDGFLNSLFDLLKIAVQERAHHRMLLKDQLQHHAGNGGILDGDDTHNERNSVLEIIDHLFAIEYIQAPLCTFSYSAFTACFQETDLFKRVYQEPEDQKVCEDLMYSLYAFDDLQKIWRMQPVHPTLVEHYAHFNDLFQLCMRGLIAPATFFVYWYYQAKSMPQFRHMSSQEYYDIFCQGQLRIHFTKLILPSLFNPEIIGKPKEPLPIEIDSLIVRWDEYCVNVAMSYGSNPGSEEEEGLQPSRQLSSLLFENIERQERYAAKLRAFLRGFLSEVERVKAIANQ